MNTAPKFSLDLLSGSLNSGVTFSRAGGTATRINSSGVMELVLADTPRFDYDPVTKDCRGLLIEEARTNNIKNSGWANAVAGTPGTAPTNWSYVTAGGTLGVSTDSLGGNVLSFTTTNNRHYMLQYFVTSANTSYCYSLNVNAIPGQLNINQIITLQGAPSGSTQIYFINGVQVASTAQAVAGDRITLLLVTGGTGSSTTAMRVGAGVSSNVTASVSVSKPQLEIAAFPTSYIPTPVGGTATRNADDALITGTSFWQAGKGGVLVRALPSTVSGTRPLVQFDDATADNIIALRGNTTNPELYIRSGGVDQATIDAGTISATAYRLAGTWAAGNAAASLNSGAAVLGAPGAIPTATQARLGSDGTNYLNGHLQALEYYDERVLNAELQRLSSTAGSRSMIQSILHPVM